MGQSDFSAWLAELKDKNDIVSVVSSYVRLTRKGRHHWGLCPFHNEKTPSFSVNGELQIYKCFGCGAAGDVIKFVQENEHTDFNGAIQILAERAGMEVPKFSKEETAADKKRNELIAVMNAAQEFFVKQLAEPHAAKAREYIANRGLSKKTVESFGLGYALPGWENLKMYLLGLGFSETMINETGLMTVNEKKSYDKFRNRIMFPIADEKGNIISYGGRKINPEDEPKYMNCPQTLLYNKSQTLYGLNVAKNFARGSGSMIIVEGYMDVITMHEFGFNTAVASCGTSLTPQQARKIKRYVDKVYIGYDGDAAGQNATIRGLDILKETGLEVFVLSFPDGCDPDDTLRKYGKEYMESVVKNAKRLEEFKIENIFRSADMMNTDAKLRAAKTAIEIAAKVQLDIERERYIEIIVKNTGYSERSVINDIERLQGKTPNRMNMHEPAQKNQTRTSVPRNPAAAHNVRTQNDIEYKTEARLLCLMVKDPSYAKAALNVVNSGCFSNDVCKRIVSVMQKLLEEDSVFGANEVALRLEDGYSAKAYDIFMLETETMDPLSETVAYAAKVKSQYYTRRADAMQKQANEMIANGQINDENCQRLIKEIGKYRMLAKSVKKIG